MNALNEIPYTPKLACARYCDLCVLVPTCAVTLFNHVAELLQNLYLRKEKLYSIHPSHIRGTCSDCHS